MGFVVSGNGYHKPYEIPLLDENISWQDVPSPESLSRPTPLACIFTNGDFRDIQFGCNSRCLSLKGETSLGFLLGAKG
jgi:hypothetical protein